MFSQRWARNDDGTYIDDNNQSDPWNRCSTEKPKVEVSIDFKDMLKYCWLINHGNRFVSCQSYRREQNRSAYFCQPRVQEESSFRGRHKLMYE